MLRRLINWFRGDSEPPYQEVRPQRRRAVAHAAVRHPKPASRLASPDLPQSEAALDGSIESQGPGKNVLVRKKYIREDTGTYETLKIVDDSILESDDEGGIDPYNSGQFDRSRHWDRRFRD